MHYEHVFWLAEGDLVRPATRAVRDFLAGYALWAYALWASLLYLLAREEIKSVVQVILASLLQIEWSLWVAWQRCGVHSVLSGTLAGQIVHVHTVSFLLRKIGSVLRYFRRSNNFLDVSWKLSARIYSAGTPFIMKPRTSAHRSADWNGSILSMSTQVWSTDRVVLLELVWRTCHQDNLWTNHWLVFRESGDLHNLWVYTPGKGRDDQRYGVEWQALSRRPPTSRLGAPFSERRWALAFLMKHTSPRWRVFIQLLTSTKPSCW